MAAAVFADANFPLLEDGRTFHLGVRAGDVAPRVLSVGDAGRAARIAAAHLDAGGARAPPVESARGFVTHTGAFRGTPVSIVATGMGTPMMDFVVREARAAVGARGGMLVVRFGTCGGLRGEDAAATVVVPSAGSVLLRRDPDAIGAGAASPYSLSRPVLPDAPLTTALLARLRAAAAPLGQAVVEGADVTCDSFYSSQGRVGAAFRDSNEGLLARVRAEVPLARSMQMETFHLLDLARASCAAAPVRASAAAIILASRAPDGPAAGSVAGKDVVAALELAGGRACLEALCETELPLSAE